MSPDYPAELEQKRRILIVDDDRDILESLQMLLKAKGYEIETAETGKEALEKFTAASFDLALLDVKLPDMDGTELLGKLRTGFHHTIKIMLTGSASRKDMVESLSLGADGYILKPIKPRELMKLLEEKLKAKT